MIVASSRKQSDNFLEFPDHLRRLFIRVKFTGLHAVRITVSEAPRGTLWLTILLRHWKPALGSHNPLVGEGCRDSIYVPSKNSSVGGSGVKACLHPGHLSVMSEDHMVGGDSFIILLPLHTCHGVSPARAVYIVTI